MKNLLLLFFLLFTFNALANSIWQFDFIPVNKQCPTLITYLKYEPKLRSMSKVSPGEKLSLNKTDNYTLEIKSEEAPFYESQIFLFGPHQTVQFKSQDKNCFGTLKIQRTRLENFHWTFVLYPEVPSLECPIQNLEAKNKIQHFSSIKKHESIEGKIKSGPVDEIELTIKTNNQSTKLVGMANLEFGNAKGHFESDQCRGFFQAKLKRITL